MESPELLLEELRQIIADSSMGIAREFIGTENSWLACYATRLTVLSLHLDGNWLERCLGPGQSGVVYEKLRRLCQRHADLKRRYPLKTDVPPATLRDELITSLDILA